MRILLTLVSFAVAVSSFAQSGGVLIGHQNQQPDPNAILELSDTARGFLLPRINQANRNAMQQVPVGLTIYNTTSECVESYFPAGWRTLRCNCTQFPSAAYQAPATISNQTPASFLALQAGTSTFQWLFSNATPPSFSGPNPTVQFNQLGAQTVSLTVTDSSGCSASRTDTVQVVSCLSNDSMTFNFTGSMQTFVVPAICGSHITVKCWGAQGGNGGPVGNGQGGLGGYAQADVPVSPGETLYVYVGGKGQDYILSTSTGGWNGGGGTNASSDDNKRPGAGGGASDVRKNGTTLNNRVVVAGGGGGSGGWQPTAGGSGGGLSGNNGQNLWGGTTGQGGSQSSGGSGANSGSFGQGGRGQGGSHGGGGGGGGWYGGGGGSIDAGGGGSGYVSASGNTNTQMSTGVRSGNGLVRIVW